MYTTINKKCVCVCFIYWTIRTGASDKSTTKKIITYKKKYKQNKTILKIPWHYRLRLKKQICFLRSNRPRGSTHPVVFFFTNQTYSRIITPHTFTSNVFIVLNLYGICMLFCFGIISTHIRRLVEQHCPLFALNTTVILIHDVTGWVVTGVYRARALHLIVNMK